MCRLWCFCCMSANWKDAEMRVSGSTAKMMIPRGSFITGRSALHKKLYRTHDDAGFRIKHDFIPSESTLWRRLEKLEKAGFLNIENVNNLFSIITICNYEKYQKFEQRSAQANEQDDICINGYSESVNGKYDSENEQPIEQCTASDMNSKPAADCLRHEQLTGTSKEFKNLRTKEKKEDPAISLETDEEKRRRFEAAQRIFPTATDDQFDEFWKTVPLELQKGSRGVFQEFNVARFELSLEMKCDEFEAGEYLIQRVMDYLKSPHGRSTKGRIELKSFFKNRHDTDSAEAWENVRDSHSQEVPKMKPLTAAEKFVS